MEEAGALLFPLLLLVVFWMLLIRPQSKRRKEQQQMVASLEVGDDVITLGGVHGRVLDVTDTFMDLAVDAEDPPTVLRFERSALARIVRDEA